MREYGVVRKDLGGDPADPASVDATAPYVGHARVLLGAVKAQMARGGLSQLSRSVTFPDGTAIQVQSNHGQDTVRIRVPGEVVEKREEVTEEVPEELEIAEPEQEEPKVVKPVGAFYVYPSKLLESVYASPDSQQNTLPWRINGKVYTKYPAGLIIPSGAKVEISCPNQSGFETSLIIFGLVALDWEGGPISTAKLQPKAWKAGKNSSSYLVQYLSKEDVAGLLPDSGPVFYAGAAVQIWQDTPQQMVFTATTPTGAGITATIRFSTPGFTYQFIDDPVTGQTVGAGVPLFSSYQTAVPARYTPALYSFGPVGDPTEDFFLHGSADILIAPVTGAHVDASQNWGRSTTGAMTGGPFQSLAEVYSKGQGWQPSIGAQLTIYNTEIHVAIPPNIPETHFTEDIAGHTLALFSGPDARDATQRVLEVIDSRTTKVSVPAIRQNLVFGTRSTGDVVYNMASWPAVSLLLSSIVYGAVQPAPPGTPTSYVVNIGEGGFTLLRTQKPLVSLK